MQLNRRAIVGSIAAVGAGTTAGCLDAIIADFEHEMPDFADWLPADPILEASTSMVDYENLEVSREWPERLIISEAQGVMELLEIEETTDAVITIETNGTETFVLDGTFDPERIDETFEVSPSDTYGDYTVYEQQADPVAVGERAIIMGEHYQQVIDAHEGEIPRVAEESDRWERWLGEVADWPLVLLGVPEDESDEDIEFTAVGTEYTDGELVALAHYIFGDETTAAEGLNQLEDELEADDALEDWDLSRDGSVVVLEMSYEIPEPTDFE